MSMLIRVVRASGAPTLSVALGLVSLSSSVASARAWIEGVSLADGAVLRMSAGAGEVSTPDGGAIHFWGYQALDAPPGAAAVPQYPGPTLVIDQNATVTIELETELPFSRCTSLVFPGHTVSATGGNPGLLARESCPGDAAPVSYTFTASEPGTYMYYSGTEPELQIEMGLVGAILVRPTGHPEWAYNHPDTSFDHEYMFLLTSMDPLVHQLAEQNRFGEIDLAQRWPVYWFINGRAAPDDLADPYVSWLPHQPYNCAPRMTPGERVLVRILGGDQDQHPLHLHGNHYYEIARYGRMLTTTGGAGPDARRFRFTTNSVPGQTVDAIFEWTGEKLGWDIYGTPADGLPAHACVDSTGDGFGDAAAGSTYAWEYCDDHGKPFPVVLPENQNLAFGGWWSGSPFMGNIEPLPPGEGGLNPFGGFFFMWHSHAEKELTNFDIFPGGMLSMMVVEPPGTPIP